MNGDSRPKNEQALADEAAEPLQVMAEQMARIEEFLAEMEKSGCDAPLDSRGLQERGYTKAESYGLLRRHGVKVPGGRRKRISMEVLRQIERGEVAP